MMRKPAVLTSLEEDLKAIGLMPHSASDIAEGKKLPAKKKGPKVLETKVKAPKAPKAAKMGKPKRGSSLVGSGKKAKVESKGLAKIAALVENVESILNDLRAEDSVDIVKGFEDISAVYKSVSNRFGVVAESLGMDEFSAISKELAALSEKTAGIAYTLANHLAEGRGSRLNYDLVDTRYKEHVATVLESLELYSEAEKLMGLDKKDSDEEEPDGDEPEGDEEEPENDKASDEEVEADDSEDSDEDSDEDDSDESGDDEEEPSEDGEEDEASAPETHEEPDGDEDGEGASDHDGDEGEESDSDEGGDSEDDDFLSDLKKRSDDSEEDESMDGMSDEGEESDEEGDDSEEGDEEVEEGDEEEPEDGESDESIVDTSSDSDEWLGTKAPPQRKDGGVPSKGKVATDNDAGHGGSWTNAYPKGKGVMKGGPMESKSPKGKARR